MNKRKAHYKARQAFPDARVCSIARCEVEGERHHPDYSKPLDIVWLCRKHHKELHRGICQECDKPHHAKGFCRTHYRINFPEKFYGKKFGVGHR